MSYTLHHGLFHRFVLVSLLQAVFILAALRWLPGEAAHAGIAEPGGFVRVTVSPEAEALVSLPFEPFCPHIESVIGPQLPGTNTILLTSAVRIWDNHAQDFVSAWRADHTGDPQKDGRWFLDFDDWTPADFTLGPGMGFWLRQPDGAVEPLDVYLSGRIVLDSVRSVSLDEGLSLFAYPFSSARALNETTLAASGAHAAPMPEDADKVADPYDSEHPWLLDAPGTAHDLTWVGLDELPSDFMLGMGQGYWYMRAPSHTLEWAAARPYAAPFSSNAMPRIQGVVVDPGAGSAILTIATTVTNLAAQIDIYYQNLDPDGTFDAQGWQAAVLNLTVAADTAEMNWIDNGASTTPAPTGVFGRVYLVVDPSLFADGNGLEDFLEHPGGFDGEGTTEPQLPAYVSQLPFFERFETDTVEPGELHAQNRWVVNQPGVALVQSDDVFEGLQALRMRKPLFDATARVSQAFTNTPETVWLDLWQQVIGAQVPDAIPTAAAAFLFNTEGRLVVADGARPAGDEWVTLTNHTPRARGQWVRLSVRADYAAQTWLICLDGILVAENLGFATPQTQFTTFEIDAQFALVDDIYLGADCPDGIFTIPGNSIPDAWHLEHFGHLDYTDDCDPDGDGLTNLEESC